MGIDALYNILLSKYEFCNNCLIESHILLKGINSYLSLIFVFLDNLFQIRYMRPKCNFVVQV